MPWCNEALRWCGTEGTALLTGSGPSRGSWSGARAAWAGAAPNGEAETKSPMTLLAHST